MIDWNADGAPDSCYAQSVNDPSGIMAPAAQVHSKVSEVSSLIGKRN